MILNSSDNIVGKLKCAFGEHTYEFFQYPEKIADYYQGQFRCKFCKKWVGGTHFYVDEVQVEGFVYEEERI